MNRVPAPKRGEHRYWKMNTEVFCLASTEVSYIKETTSKRKWKPEIMTVNYFDTRWIAKLFEIDLDEDNIFLVDMITGQLYKDGVCMSNKRMTLEA